MQHRNYVLVTEFGQYFTNKGNVMLTDDVDYAFVYHQETAERLRDKFNDWGLAGHYTWRVESFI